MPTRVSTACEGDVIISAGTTQLSKSFRSSEKARDRPTSSLRRRPDGALCFGAVFQAIYARIAVTECSTSSSDRLVEWHDVTVLAGERVVVCAAEEAVKAEKAEQLCITRLQLDRRGRPNHAFHRHARLDEVVAAVS